MAGFGCKVIGFDMHRSPEFERIGGTYADRDEIQAEADIISLHCPLTPQTHHIVNAHTLARVKKGALLINTSRGGLVDTQAVIEALKSGRPRRGRDRRLRARGFAVFQGSVGRGSAGSQTKSGCESPLGISDGLRRSRSGGSERNDSSKRYHPALHGVAAGK
jgi:hypothetical protein